MITTKKISNEIDKLLAGNMSWDSIGKLNELLEAHHRLEKYHDIGGSMDSMESESYTLSADFVNHITNADGTHGAHWNMEETNQVLKQRGYHFDSLEFFIVMNMLYSDYCEVFHKYGVTGTDFYAELARAWINDPDAKPNKTAEYFCRIANRK